jgi:hypothetical protein
VSLLIYTCAELTIVELTIALLPELNLSWKFPTEIAKKVLRLLNPSLQSAGTTSNRNIHHNVTLTTVSEQIASIKPYLE